MKDVKLKVELQRPAAEAFAFALKPANTPKWLDFIVREEANEWPVKKGSIYRNQNKAGEWSEYEVTEFEPNKAFAIANKSGAFSVRYTFIPTSETSCEFEYYLWVDKGELEVSFSKEHLSKFKQVIEAE